APRLPDRRVPPASAHRRGHSPDRCLERPIRDWPAHAGLQSEASTGRRARPPPGNRSRPGCTLRSLWRRRTGTATEWLRSTSPTGTAEKLLGPDKPEGFFSDRTRPTGGWVPGARSAAVAAQGNRWAGPPRPPERGDGYSWRLSSWEFAANNESPRKRRSRPRRGR